MNTNSILSRRLLAAARRSLLPATLLVLLGAPLHAEDLPRPDGPVVLTVTGAITRTNAPGRAEFDYAMLAELGLVTREIDTPWTEPGTRFEGVPARRLMERVGAEGRWVEARAANDYRVDVPLSDLVDHPTLLALSEDGERMRLRGRGPVWLLYDGEDRPAVEEDELLERMVWQLRSLDVVE